MFFSDYGQNSRIEKASLDGQNREVIVYRGLYKSCISYCGHWE